MSKTYSPVCESCGTPAEFVIIHRLVHPRSICWFHKIYPIDDPRPGEIHELLVCGDVARIDRGRWGGDVPCEICGKKMHDHPADSTYPFMTLHCDGSLMKL